MVGEGKFFFCTIGMNNTNINKRDLRIISLTLLVLSLHGICGTTWAQDSSTTLEGVEVVSRHTFSDVIPSQTLNAKQLERLNSLNVADALRYFSGLQVKDYGGVGGIKTVNIRSMGSQHLGVYYDGIELGNAQNGQIDLGQFSLDNVEAVTLYNGQKSSLMQTASDYGNAGSIYIRTRIPHFTMGKKDNLRAKVKYGSSNMLLLSAVYERKFTDKLNLSVTLGTLTSDGKYKFRYMRKNTDGTVAYDTTAIRQNGDVQTLRIEGNLNGLLQRGSWNFKAYTYQSNRGIPGAIVNNVWRREERQVDSNTFFQGSWQQDVTDVYSFRVLGKYANYYTHYQNRDTTVMMVDNRYRQQEAYVSTTHSLQLLSWLAASMAYDLRWSTLSADVYTCPEPDRWNNMLSLAVAVNLRRFSAQGSLLYNHVRDKGDATHRDNKGNMVSTAAVSMQASNLTPALFLNYYLLRDKSLSLRGYIKNSFRMPTFNDLYYAEVGNSMLRPEKATQYDIGVRYTPTSRRLADGQYDVRRLMVSAQADFYFNNVTDKIIAYPKGQQFRWTMLNLGHVHITGLDLETGASYAFTQNLRASLRLQYTWQKAIDVTNEQDSYYRHQIPYIPEHSGSAIFNFDWKDLSFNYSFIYTGERYSQQENIVYNHLEPWYTSDISLAYRFKVRKCDVRATFEVNNLFAQDYDVILNYPMPRRSYAVAVDIKL